MIKFPQLQDPEWLAEQVKTKTQREIAAELGCSGPTVCQACKRLGIEVPHRTKHRYNPEKSAIMKAAYKRRFPNGRFGEEHPRWKGGIWKQASSGYMQEQRSGVTKYQHRWVMEEVLGRELLPGEEVHHINGVRDDNRPENLELWSKSQPAGARVEDKIKWALELLALYAPECLNREGENRCLRG